MHYRSCARYVQAEQQEVSVQAVAMNASCLQTLPCDTRHLICQL